MKFGYIYLILLCGLSASFIQANYLHGSKVEKDCKTVIDSAKAFIQTSEFAVNAKPAVDDHSANLRIDKWLRNLSFRNLTCLLDNDDISLKALGFMYAANQHGDSLLKTYSYLLIDTTSVQLYMIDGSTSPKMKLGELLSKMAQSIKEDHDNFAKRPEIEKVVSAFIREYSAYPTSYKSVSFPYFSMGSDNKGVSNFNIQHDYEIRNNKGRTVRVISAFVLDKNLNINVIEKDSSSFISSYPAKLDYWISEFGRKLSKKDSLTLKLQ